MQSNKSNSKFLKGAAVLGMAAIVIKIIGAFFRIPLANLIGDTGMSYYQTAYPLYNWLLVLSTAGLPPAMAKVIAERNAVEDHRGVQRIFSTMLIFMIGMGVLGALIMVLSAGWISHYVKNEGGYMSFLALAPAVFFVSIMASFRGYFQGLQDMKPYGLSQIVEQLFRVSVGLGLTFLLFDKGLRWASAGATFGATTGAFFGMLMLMGFYARYRKKEKSCNDDAVDKGEEESFPLQSRKSIIKKIIMIAIPITVGSSIIPLMTILDLFIVIRRLHDIGMVQTASALYGQLTGYAQTLVNLPQTVCAAIQISVVPAVAAAVFIKNKKNLNDTIHMGMRLGLIVGLPAAFGFILLAEPIMKLLYPMQVDIAQNTGAILSILGWGVIFLPLYQISTGAIQGMGKPHKPAIHLFLGAVLKGVLNYVLVGIPFLNIKGAAIATVSAFVLATILNFIELFRSPDVVLDMKEILFKPFLSVGIMAILIRPMHRLFIMLTGHESLATVGAVGVCGVVYIIALFVTGAINVDELEMIPGGSKIKALIRRQK